MKRLNQVLIAMNLVAISVISACGGHSHPSSSQSASVNSQNSGQPTTESESISLSPESPPVTNSSVPLPPPLPPLTGNVFMDNRLEGRWRGISIDPSSGAPCQNIEIDHFGAIFGLSGDASISFVIIRLSNVTPVADTNCTPGVDYEGTMTARWVAPPEEATIRYSITGNQLTLEIGHLLYNYERFDL